MFAHSIQVKYKCLLNSLMKLIIEFFHIILCTLLAIAEHASNSLTYELKKKKNLIYENKHMKA